MASTTPAKPARAVRVIHVEGTDSDSESDLSGSDTEREPRNIFVAATSDRPTKFGYQRPMRIVKITVRVASRLRNPALIVDRRDTTIVDAGRD